jgi:hypothetical protein
MSKFIDKLNRISKTVAQPMGFRATSAVAERSRIQIIASVAESEIDGLAGSVAGADAVLLSIPKSGLAAEALKKISKVLSEIPWGGWLGGIAKGKMKQMIENGCDYVVFPAADTSLGTPAGEEVGKILQIETSLSEGMLRTINQVAVDAVLVSTEHKGKYDLTWHQLMLFQRIANMVTKPLLVPIPSNTAGSELQVLWDAGVDGVVVETGAGKPAEELKKLRKVVDGLTFPTTRKHEKREAVLPRVDRDTEAVTELEEDEEEEE